MESKTMYEVLYYCPAMRRHYRMYIVTDSFVNALYKAANKVANIERVSYVGALV
jgi:hypothetical protein